MPHLVLTIPPRELRVNAGLRSHPLAYHRAATEYRKTVGMEALAQEREWKGRTYVWPVKLTVAVVVSGNRKVDSVDALTWLKAAIDELVALGVWPDDSCEYLNPVQVVVERGKRPRAELWWLDATGRC